LLSIAKNVKNVTFLLKVPSSYTFCVHPSNLYRVELDSTTESKVVNNYNKDNYTVYGDSEDTITVKVQIRNKDGDLSSPATNSLTVPTGLRIRIEIQFNKAYIQIVD